MGGTASRDTDDDKEEEEEEREFGERGGEGESPSSIQKKNYLLGSLFLSSPSSSYLSPWKKRGKGRGRERERSYMLEEDLSPNFYRR